MLLIIHGMRTEASKIIIQAHELIGSLTYCEDAQNEGRKQGVIHVFDPIQSVQPTNTVMLRYTRISQQSGASTLASLSPAKWLGLSHRQAKNPRIMLTTEGRILEEILKTKFNLRSSTEEEDELKIAPRP